MPNPAFTLDKFNPSILKDLNNNLLLCGKTFHSNDPENPIPNPDLNSIFYDSSTFIKKFRNTDPSILASLNAQSLLSKHDNLQLLISELTSTPLHILAIQETWAIPHPHLVSIPGFNFTHLERKIGRGGGVGFYVRNDLIFRQLPNFSTFIPKIFECLTIEVSIDNRKSTFSTIYRSPSDNSESLNEFITHLDQLLFELTSSYQNSYICLDSNINSLIQNPSPLHAKYFSTIFENGFIQVINKATRITQS